MILAKTPKAFPGDLPELLFTQGPFLQLLSKHEDALDPRVRQRYLQASLSHADSAVVKDALSSLRDEEKDGFSGEVLSHLHLGSDPHVLKVALELCGRWKLSEGKQRLEDISRKARWANIQKMADEALKAIEG